LLHDLHTINNENLIKQIQFEGLLCNESKKLAQDIIEVKAKYLFIVSLYSLQIKDYKRVRREYTGFNRYSLNILHIFKILLKYYRTVINKHWVHYSNFYLFYHAFTV